jgi:hypothetical protein
MARDAAARAFQRLGDGNVASFTVNGDNRSAEDDDVRAAIEASLSFGGARSSGGSDDDLARALAASLATAGPGGYPGAGGAKRAAAEISGEDSEDADLAAAIAASVAEAAARENKTPRADEGSKSLSVPGSVPDDGVHVTPVLGAEEDDRHVHADALGDVPPEPSADEADAMDVAVRGGGARARGGGSGARTPCVRSKRGSGACSVWTCVATSWRRRSRGRRCWTETRLWSRRG